jgi:hypothetical protein
MLESLPECGDDGLSFPVAFGKRHQHADPSHAVWLLRPRCDRPPAAPPRSVMNWRRFID